MRCVVFDLDGTLVDSVPDLTAAANRMLAARGLASVTIPEVTRMVGDGVAALVRRAFAARGAQADEAAIDGFTADYTAHAADATTLFPGAAEALAELTGSGWRLAICTNKPEAAAHALLAALGVDHLFAAIGGGDSFPVRKPDPAHLRATLERAGGTPGRAVMVGDHRNDVAAAAGAGLPCIFAAWGYGTPEMSAGAARVAHRIAEVPAMAADLLGA
ncbi:MAG TPA: phosphoglycolate phosphatase [Acidisphaera sp.]|nr:phosphoglycolate phosphatase [Acidisphaera sp.]